MPKCSRTGADPSTSERLAAAAVQLIAEDGWAAVTTRRVAERAGVNQGLVHYHYGSVAALRREAALQRDDGGVRAGNCGPAQRG